MPTLTITKTYDDDTVLTEEQLDDIKDSIETFINVTKLDADNLQTSAVTTDKIGTSAVTTAKIADDNVTGAKLEDDILLPGAPSTGGNLQVGQVAPATLIIGGSGGAKLTGIAVGTVHLGANGVSDAALKDSSSARTMDIMTGGGSTVYGIAVAPYTTHGQKIVAGDINSDGTTASGSGFTSATSATGTYNITFSSAFASTSYQVVACFRQNNGLTLATAPRIGVSITSTTVCQIQTRTNASTSSDMAFHFIAIGERGD